MKWSYFFKVMLVCVGISLSMILAAVFGTWTFVQYKDWKDLSWNKARTYEACLCEFGTFENLPEEETIVGVTWNPKAQCESAKLWAEQHGYEHPDRKYDGFPFYQERHREYLKRRRK